MKHRERNIFVILFVYLTGSTPKSRISGFLYAFVIHFFSDKGYVIWLGYMFVWYHRTGVKWKTKFQFKLIWPRIFDFEQLFWRYPIQKYPEKCYNPCYEVCLLAWQTDDWSSLRKNKFHPSNIRNEVGFCDSWSLGGYLSASFMIIPAGKCQSSGETNIDLLDGIFVL